MAGGPPHPARLRTHPSSPALLGGFLRNFRVKQSVALYGDRGRAKVQKASFLSVRVVRVMGSGTPGCPVTTRSEDKSCSGETQVEQASSHGAQQ